MSLLYDLGGIFVKWGPNVWIVESLKIYLQTIYVFGCRNFWWSIVITLFILIAFVIGAEVFGWWTWRIAFIIGAEVVGWRTWQVKDDVDEDSFENLEEWSSIDPSAIVNSFLGTDFERSQVSPWACTESLADLLDGILAPPIVFFWLLEEILSFSFCGLRFLSFVCTSQLVAWLRSKPWHTGSLVERP